MADFETIGKIRLDLSKYPGEDFYCDGAVEDELLDIVKNRSKAEYGQVIEEKKSWPILYHLSSLRENIVEWIPMKKTDKVLEVGSGCGAITGVLAKKAGQVECVELSKKRSTINAYKNEECDNVNIHVGNFKDIEPDLATDFDYICLIGVFEYGKSYIGGENPYEDFIKILMPHLKKGGRIIIAIENKLGLKYFAGCKEDHLGTYFSGIENYKAQDGVRTFSRRGLEKIFKRTDVKEYHFYYPYPDYKFMTTLYSDAYQPGKGELSNNIRNFDRDRMMLFDEKAAFDGIIEDDMFPLFSNSFIAVIGKDFDIKYVKYSNDRAPEYAIKTVISRSATKGITVRKYPYGEKAADHIRELMSAYENLKDRYSGSDLKVNKCKLTDNGKELYADLEFVDGKPLSELMDKALYSGDMDEFNRLFDKYLERIGYNPDYPVADFDLIFSNILVDEKDEWTLIDYEWTFGRAIDTKELAFRALYCYVLEDEKRNSLNLSEILEKLNITQAEAEDYRTREADFQKYVTSGHRSMAEIGSLIGNRIADPGKWIDRYASDNSASRIQIYEDKGEGFSEENSYFTEDLNKDGTTVKIEINVDCDVKVLRVDPAFSGCIVRLKEVLFNGEVFELIPKKNLLANGKIIKGEGNAHTLVFATDDPNIHFDLTSLNRENENTFSAVFEVVMMPSDMAADLQGAIKKIF